MVNLLPVVFALAQATQLRFDYARPNALAVSIGFDDVSLIDGDEIGLLRRCSATPAYVRPPNHAYLLYNRTEDITASIQTRQRLVDENLHWTDLNSICIDYLTIKTRIAGASITDVSGIQLGHAALPTQNVIGRKDDQRLEAVHCNALLLPRKAANANLRTTLAFRNGNTKPRVSDGNLTQLDHGSSYIWSRSSSTRVFDSRTFADLGVEAQMQALRTCSFLTFIDNNPMINVKLARSFEVPQWTSKIRVDEIYSLMNDAAKRGSQYRGSEIHQIMRRVIGTRRQNTGPLLGSTTLYNMEAYFPPGTTGHEFFDPIGNISTSQVIEKRPNEIQRIELEPRFPILGTWKSDWTLRYHVLAEVLMSKMETTNTYKLGVLALPAIPNFWSDASSVDILLPPFATIKDIKTPLLDPLLVTTSSEKRWLDITSSRTKVHLEFGPHDLKPQPTNLVQLTFETSPLLATISHLLWLPIISTLMVIFISLPSVTPTLTHLAAQILLSSTKSKDVIAKKAPA